MPDLATLALFAVSSLAILAIPGPTMLYIVTRTVEHGRDAGLISAAGVGVGTLTHVAAAAVGLSALLASSQTAITAVQVIGAGYLVWLGAQRLRRRDRAAAHADGARAGRARLFWQGVLMDALNPKTALFFLAFLPQFVDPAAGAVAGQVLVLGCCFALLAAACDTACALAAGAARSRLARAGTSRVDRVTGLALVGLGAFVLFTGAHPA